MKKLLTLCLSFGLLGAIGCGDPPKPPAKAPVKADEKKPEEKKADEKKPEGEMKTGERENKKGS